MTGGRGIATIALALALGLGATLSACANTVYQDSTRESTVVLPWQNRVVFHVAKAYLRHPPDCIAIMPLAAKTPAMSTITKADAARLRLALFGHLAPQAKRIVKPSRVDHVLAELPPAAPDRPAALGRRLECDSVMTGTVTAYGKEFFGIYSRVVVGVRLTLRRTGDGALLWKGHTTAVSNGGDIPISPIGVAMGIVDAVDNMRQEELLRLGDDVARRLVATIPDNRVAAITDPAAAPVRLPRKKPPPVDDVAKGRRLIAKGDYGGALAAADRAIAAHPGRAPGYFLKGRVLILEGDYAKAERPILDAVARDRNNALYLNALGAVSAQIGAPDRALAAYHMAIATDPADGFAYYNTGVIRYASGDLAGAAYNFYGAGLAYLKTGDYGRAEKALADLKLLSGRGLHLDRQISTIDNALKALTRRKT